MGHEITDTDQMFSVREMPWHRLGVVLDDYPTRREAQELAHPWEPVEAPVFKRVPYINSEGVPDVTFEEVEGTKAIERSDNGDTIGVVNSTLGLVSNEQMWDVAEAVGSIGQDVRIETAGSLEGGAKVWALLRLEEPLKVKGDPNGESIAFLAIQNAHNGSGSFRAQAVNTRIVCANTSSAADTEARKNGYEFTFRHTAKVQDRIEDAKAAVSMWRHGVEVWQNAMEHLVDVKVSPEQVTEFIERFQPMPPEHLISDRVRSNVEEARADLRGVLNSETGEGIRDSAYGLFQGAVEWSQHVRQVRGKDETARMESFFKRSMLTDDGLRTKTLSLIKEVAHA